jgi:uncharacterized protein
MIDYFAIIQKYISVDSPLYRIYIPHAVQVTQKALAIAKTLELAHAQLEFIEEGGMLHDIGITQVYAPDIGCHGDKDYILHGIEGRVLLEKEGLYKHALICERHIGVGIRQTEIKRRNLPLPHRDMIPQTLEEELLCYADLFFSKDPEKLWYEKSLSKIRKKMAKYGSWHSHQLDEWTRRFEKPARP